MHKHCLTVVYSAKVISQTWEHVSFEPVLFCVINMDILLNSSFILSSEKSSKLPMCWCSSIHFLALWWFLSIFFSILSNDHILVLRTPETYFSKGMNHRLFLFYSVLFKKPPDFWHISISDIYFSFSNFLSFKM